MQRLLLFLVVVPVVALPAQTPRFRYDLTNDPPLSPQVRQSVDSARTVSDSVHGCPSRGDTLWTGELRASIPDRWLAASLRPDCGHTALPNAVRRRLRDDPSSLNFYEHVVSGRAKASEAERAKALLMLSWSGDAKYFALLLRVATEQLPGLAPGGDYNASYNAIISLAPYVGGSSKARALIQRQLGPSRSGYARNAAIIALASANDAWSRRMLRASQMTSIDEFILAKVHRALAHAPCPRGSVFVEWFGIEGQDYSKCELPPDYR
ncbi:MAG: hypothetical protein JWO05_2807 [Gemmatimonadetes bacterium]|nr:hypothetical protein [Gemmatimonadota bacterium]